MVLLGLATAAVVAAQPVRPVARSTPRSRIEPAWMVLSGAALLAMASIVRRYVP